MKVLNVILCVLTLLLAAAAATSSYFLYEKRAKMVSGWQKLAEAIGQTAAVMDKGSGTQVAKELDVVTLGHANADKLDTPLGKLRKQAELLIVERDKMAEALRRIGATVGMKNPPQQDTMTGMTTYNAAMEDVFRSVDDMKNARNRLIDKLVNMAKTVDVRLDAEALRDGDVEAGMRAFDDKIRSIRNQFNAYQQNARAVASVTGCRDTNFSESQYSKSLSAITNSVRNLKNKLNAANNELNRTKQALSSEKNNVKQRDGQIAAHKNTIGRKNEEISQYRKALGMEPAEEFKPWDPGSPEVLRMVVGKVLEVNGKFGFVAINIGKDTTVAQPIGKKTTQVNPMLTKGMDLLVARNMDTPDVKYIGKIKLTNVDADCSIAEVVEVAPDCRIETGDSVFFAESGKLPAAK